jgi:hypothetical protein
MLIVRDIDEGSLIFVLSLLATASNVHYIVHLAGLDSSHADKSITSVDVDVFLAPHSFYSPLISLHPLHSSLLLSSHSVLSILLFSSHLTPSSPFFSSPLISLHPLHSSLLLSSHSILSILLFSSHLTPSSPFFSSPLITSLLTSLSFTSPL